MFGQCVGLGDAFDVMVEARPEYRDGNLGLADVAVTSPGKSGFYIRRVCAALAASLGREFRYPLAAQARKVLEDPGRSRIIAANCATSASARSASRATPWC